MHVRVHTREGDEHHVRRRSAGEVGRVQGAYDIEVAGCACGQDPFTNQYAQYRIKRQFVVRLSGQRLGRALATKTRSGR